MLFVGTSIIHPSTEGVFLLCNILDLLIYSSLYKQKIIEAKELVQMLFVIENYIIRRFVCGVPSNQLNKIFPPIFSQMQKIEEDSYLLNYK